MLRTKELNVDGVKNTFVAISVYAMMAHVSVAIRQYHTMKVTIITAVLMKTVFLTLRQMLNVMEGQLYGMKFVVKIVCQMLKKAGLCSNVKMKILAT